MLTARSVLLVVPLLCLCSLDALPTSHLSTSRMSHAIGRAATSAAAAGGQLSSPRAPTPWPEQFHATMFQNRSNQLAIVDLYYDWPGKRNMNIIRSQLGAKGTLYDIEHDNHTSFYFNKDLGGKCKTIIFQVGILFPNWLDGSVYLGQEVVNNFTTHVFTKEDFITYYEDADTGRPVRWFFHSSTGQPAQFEVMTWEEGGQAPEEEWQAPASCFVGTGVGEQVDLSDSASGGISGKVVFEAE